MDPLESLESVFEETRNDFEVHVVETEVNLGVVKMCRYACIINDQRREKNADRPDV